MSKKAEAWMPLWIGDYLADTQRLTCEQHGAYLLLIFDYWRNGPPPDDNDVLRSICRLDVKAWARHRRAIEPLFQVREGAWHHKRIDAELGNARGRAVKGSAGGGARWGGDDTAERGRHMRSQRMSEARQKGTHSAEEWVALIAFCGGACVRCSAKGKLVKDHITPIYQGGSDAIENLQPLCQKCNASKGPEATDFRREGWLGAVENACGEGISCLQNAKTSPSPSPVIEDKPLLHARRAASLDQPGDVGDQVWGDFLRLRKTKRAPLTETALAGIRKEAGKAGVSLEDALAECCARGWQGFKADWHEREKRNGRSAAGPQPSGFSRALRQMAGETDH